jgi:hypothetical protein
MTACRVRLRHLVLVVVSCGAGIVACSTTTVTPSSEAAPKGEGEGGDEESGGDDGSEEPDAKDAGRDGSMTSAACPDCLPNLCEDKTATEACAACVKAASANGGACQAVTIAACEADPICQAYARCSNGCNGGGGGDEADEACFAMAGTACTSCCRTTHEGGSEVIVRALKSCICGE